MDELQKYFDLSPIQHQQFAALEPLYSQWNAQINVISRKDMAQLYPHHVLHSLAIAKAVQFAQGTRILDVGTGGGFPGLPLATMFPQVQFLLVDSIAKKLKVVDDIAQQLGLNNVQTRHTRVEDVHEQFDFVTARAVTRLDTIWGWVANKISTQNNNTLPNGLLYLKGGDIAAELPRGVSCRRYELADWYAGDYFAQKSLIHLYPSVRQ